MIRANRILIVGVSIAIAFWFVEPIMDMLLEGHFDYFQALFKFGSVELSLRTTISLTFMVFAMYAQRTISSRHRYERKLVEQQKSLEALNREMEAFSYSVSHDLKVPLRHIEGFLGILDDTLDGKLSSEGNESIIHIKNACQRMNNLIDSLLKLSRITREEINKVPVDLSEIAERISSLLKQSEPDRNVTFNIEKNIVRNVDTRLFQILLENLLGNAWKFTSRVNKAVIDFGIDKSNAREVLFVRDNGAGFNSKRAEDIFIPFQRLHSGEDFSGSGIGLATVKRIISRHDGEIWAIGAEGKGATIYFTLPRGY